jgi:nitroreductase
MEMLEIIKKRYSVRDYTTEAVDDEKILKILEAGKWAPSACNIQPCTIIVIRKTASKEKLRPAYNRDWFINAPVIIAVCVDRKSAWSRSDGLGYGMADAAIIMDHMILTASELGLGTCWIGAFKVPEARIALQLPDHIDPIVFSPLGYPAKEAPIKKRKEIEALTSWEYFGGAK